MELLEEKKKRRRNELAISLFYHFSENLTFFLVLLNIMKGHCIINAGREQSLSLNLRT